MGVVENASKLLAKEPKVKLYLIQKVESFTNSEIIDFLNFFYKQEDSVVNLMGTFFNSIFTHKKQSFIFSKRIMNRLAQIDFNLKFKTFSYETYKDMMKRLFTHDYLVRIREPQGKRAGVYKILDPDIVRILYEIAKDEYQGVTPQEYFESQEMAAVDFYDIKGKKVDENIEDN
ncbi:MAG: hypothetical protein PHF86_10560 [Candidatus Nanoarchaeia archaeon]|nr:hypothetical protein [Candidatus Nanoarchaeia archaeon]